MKRAGLLALMISLTLVSGCEGSAEYGEIYAAWRESFLGRDGHTIEAVVTASDEEQICEYTLLYTKTAGEETVEVLSPEMIARIKAHIETADKSVKLSYDGALLDTGSALSEELSPLMALPGFVRLIAEGHFETGWREKKDETELIVSELELPDGTRMTLWQLAGDMTPLRADIRSADRVEIRLDITQFD